MKPLDSCIMCNFQAPVLQQLQELKVRRKFLFLGTFDSFFLFSYKMLHKTKDFSSTTLCVCVKVILKFIHLIWPHALVIFLHQDALVMLSH